MGKYAAIFAKSVKAELRYRSATLASLASSLLMFVIQIFLWRAVLGQGEVSGVRLPDMLLYVVITAFVGKLSSVNLSDKIEATIVDGTVSMEIIRPYSYKMYWFSTITGKNFYATMVALVPMLLISAFFVPVSALPNAASVLLFIPAVLLGVLITFELNYVFGLLAFWIQRCWFLGWYLSGFKSIFGGTVVPLWFYPDFLRKMSDVLPFKYMSFEPVNIFLGRTAPQDAWQPILVAALWLAALCALDALMWRQATKRLSVNGG